MRRKVYFGTAVKLPEDKAVSPSIVGIDEFLVGDNSTKPLTLTYNQFMSRCLGQVAATRCIGGFGAVLDGIIDAHDSDVFEAKRTSPVIKINGLAYDPVLQDTELKSALSDAGYKVFILTGDQPNQDSVFLLDKSAFQPGSLSILLNGEWTEPSKNGQAIISRIESIVYGSPDESERGFSL